MSPPLEKAAILSDAPAVEGQFPGPRSPSPLAPFGRGVPREPTVDFGCLAQGAPGGTANGDERGADPWIEAPNGWHKMGSPWGARTQTTCPAERLTSSSCRTTTSAAKRWGIAARAS